MRIPFLIFLFLMQYLGILAQEHENRHRVHERVPIEERADRQTKIMTDSLALDEVQASSIHEINLKYIKAREELMAEEISRQEKMFNIETLEIKQHKEFKKVLTKEQFKKLQEMEERRKEAMRQKFMERRNKRGN